MTRATRAEVDRMALNLRSAANDIDPPWVSWLPTESPHLKSFWRKVARAAIRLGAKPAPPARRSGRRIR